MLGNPVSGERSSTKFSAIVESAMAENISARSAVFIDRVSHRTAVDHDQNSTTPNAEKKLKNSSAIQPCVRLPSGGPVRRMLNRP